MSDTAKVFTEHDLYCPEVNEGRFVPDALIDNVEHLHMEARSAGFCQLRDTIQLRRLEITGRRDVKAISGGDAGQGTEVWRKDYSSAKATVLREWVMTRKGYQEVTNAS